MRLRYATYLFALACITLAFPARSSSDDLTPLEKAYVGLEKVARDNAESDDRTKLISEAYAKSFGGRTPSELSKVPSRDLHAIYMAAAFADFYDATDQHLSDMRAAINALQERKEASRSDIETFYGSLFQGRKFDELAAFYKAHPDAGLQLPVAFIGTEQPVQYPHGVLDVAPNEVAVSGRTIDLNHGTHIVVIAHPTCHYTRNAIASIEADPSLKKVFAKHAEWVATVDRTPDLSPFQEWNKAHREASMSIAYSESGWPEVRIWQTPTFLFYKDGKVVGEVIGWPKEGNEQALRAELTRLGLSETR